MLRHQKLEPRRALQYKTIIIDESHGLKTRDSQRTRFMAPVLKAAKRVILLSGTPIDGKPVQAFSQVRHRTSGTASEHVCGVRLPCRLHPIFRQASDWRLRISSVRLRGCQTFWTS